MIFLTARARHIVMIAVMVAVAVVFVRLHEFIMGHHAIVIGVQLVEVRVKMLLVPFMMIHIRSRGRCIRAGAHSGVRGLGWVGKAGARQTTCSEKAGGGKAE